MGSMFMVTIVRYVMMRSLTAAHAFGMRILRCERVTYSLTAVILLKHANVRREYGQSAVMLAIQFHCTHRPRICMAALEENIRAY